MPFKILEMKTCLYTTCMSTVWSKITPLLDWHAYWKNIMNASDKKVNVILTKAGTDWVFLGIARGIYSFTHIIIFIPKNSETIC